MFLIHTLALAAGPPPIEAAPCNDCAPPTPATELYRLHIDRATEIYSPYWSCYGSHAFAHPDFGTSDKSAAQEVLASSRNACLEPLRAADQAFDAFIGGLQGYGDRDNQLRIREDFRVSAGMLVLAVAASQSGVLDKFKATTQAALGNSENEQK